MVNAMAQGRLFYSIKKLYLTTVTPNCFKVLHCVEAKEAITKKTKKRRIYFIIIITTLLSPLISM